jgi:nitrate/nitrite transport system substrate-binding protein
MATALSLGLGGNAITVSLELWREIEQEAPEADAPTARAQAIARAVARRRAAGLRRLRLATVFPVSMHAYELRGWLAAAGVVPDRDVRLPVVPPPRMVAELEAGTIDGFCVGEPWSSVAVQRGSGAIVATKRDLWSGAPEKVLAVTQAWARRHPRTHRALLRALLRAAVWCDEPASRVELARLLSGRGYIEAPVEALLPSLTGRLDLVPGGRPRELPDFHSFHRAAATFPWRSHAAWIVAQMLRWGQLEKAVDVRSAAAAIYWTDLHREAAAEVGIPCPASDEKVEADEHRFDARRTVDYLRGLAVHARKVPLDELEAAQRTPG